MKKITAIFLLVFIVFLSACTRKNESASDISILVFITGVIAGSPPYELMAEGALEFAKNNPKVSVKIYEAGMNQALWQQQLAEMVSGGEYDVVIGSNPSLPEICINVLEMFPDQKFIITDAHHEGNPNIKTYSYNQYEQSLFLGYLAGLITTSDMQHVNSQRKIGFIAAQEFPLLTRQMLPGFAEGAKLVDPEIEVDFRVIGSWADANKAAELASAMINTGVDVFTAIAGGAAHGLVKTAVERGAYIVWFNTNAYHLAPGFIVGCGIMEQKKLVIEILEDFLAGRIQYGTSKMIGVKEGYLGFMFDDDSYQNLPADIRNRFEVFLKEYF
jgi:simple sugar transport system substrate-binding protein